MSQQTTNMRHVRRATPWGWVLAGVGLVVAIIIGLVIWREANLADDSAAEPTGPRVINATDISALGDARFASLFADEQAIVLDDILYTRMVAGSESYLVGFDLTQATAGPSIVVRSDADEVCERSTEVRDRIVCPGFAYTASEDSAIYDTSHEPLTQDEWKRTPAEIASEVYGVDMHPEAIGIRDDAHRIDVYTDGSTLLVRNPSDSFWTRKIGDGGFDVNALGDQIPLIYTDNRTVIAADSGHLTSWALHDGQIRWQIATEIDSWVATRDVVLIQRGSTVDQYPLGNQPIITTTPEPAGELETKDIHALPGPAPDVNQLSMLGEMDFSLDTDDYHVDFRLTSEGTMKGWIDIGKKQYTFQGDVDIADPISDMTYPVTVQAFEYTEWANEDYADQPVPDLLRPGQSFIVMMPGAEKSDVTGFNVTERCGSFEPAVYFPETGDLACGRAPIYE